ncbi:MULTISPECIES: condensation domain-containing protein [unclassified Streptomyces]|uniref:condensation domain-containing protein n=1 Tax=unclassified Streptomyces TaxID=2593676 RepID=UPI002E2E49F6|nr:condensation domain-containing protein [Streptomyces sp. NBC_00228]
MTANRFPYAPTALILAPAAGSGSDAGSAPWDLELRGPLDAAALEDLLHRLAADGQDPAAGGGHRLLRHGPGHHTLRCTAHGDMPAAAVAGRIADLLTTTATVHPLTPAQRALLTPDGTRAPGYGCEAFFLETAAGTDTETVRRALHTVVAAHPQLRHRLDTAAGHLTGPPGPGGQDLLTEGEFTDEPGHTAAVTALSRALDPSAGIHLRALLARDHRPARPDRLTLLIHPLATDPTTRDLLLTDLTRALGPATVIDPTPPDPLTPGDSAPAVAPAAGLSPASEPGPAAGLPSALEPGLAAGLPPASEPGRGAGLSPALEPGPAAGLPSASEPGLAAGLSPASEPGRSAGLSLAPAPASAAVRARCAGDGLADWVAGLRELARDPAEARHWSLVAERRSRSVTSSAAGMPRPGGEASTAAPAGTGAPTDTAAPADTGASADTVPLPTAGTGPGVGSGTTPCIAPDSTAVLPTPENGPDTSAYADPNTDAGAAPDTGADAGPDAGPGTRPGTTGSPSAPETGPASAPETPPHPQHPLHQAGFILDEEQTERITRHLARRLALTAEQVLTGVFALALARWQRTDEVGFDVRSDPRSGHPGLRRHAGRLTDVHPVQLTLDPGPDALGQLAAAAGFLAAGAGRAAGGAGFGACREFSPDPLLRATLRALPPASACLVLHAPHETPSATAHPVPGIPQPRTHCLQAHARITSGRLHFTLDRPPARPAGTSAAAGHVAANGAPGTGGPSVPSTSTAGAALTMPADFPRPPAATPPPAAADRAAASTAPSATAGVPDLPPSADAAAATGRTAPSAAPSAAPGGFAPVSDGPPAPPGRTVPSASPDTTEPPAPPTLTLTPTPAALAALLQDVLEELAGSATAPVPGVFAPTAQQAALYAGGEGRPGTGRHVEQVVWVWRGPLDAGRFEAAWQSVFDREAVLRTAFTGTSPPRLIVHGRVTPDITRRIPSGADRAPFLERDRLRGFDLRRPGPLRLTLLEPEQAPPAGPGTSTRIVLTYHRALLDTWSAHLLLRTFYRAYLAGGTLPGGQRRPDLRDYTAWIAAQDPRPARALWARLTPPAVTAAASRPGRRGAATGGSGVGRARLRLDAAETVRLARWAGTWGTAESSVLQAVWALLIYRASGATGAAPVCFAVTVPGRGIALDGAAWLPGPLRNLLPMSLDIDPAHTLPRLLRHLRDRALDMAACEWLPAEPPPGTDGEPQPGRAETVLVFEDVPHPVHGLESELAAHGIRAEFPGTVPARSALPLALLAHHDDTGGLVLTGVHDRALLDEDAAAELLVQSALLLRELPLTADESTTVAQALELLEGRDIPLMADDTPAARTAPTASAASGPAGTGGPLTLLRAARDDRAGTICLLSPPGAPPTCYDQLPPAYSGPQELLLLTDTDTDTDTDTGNGNGTGVTDTGAAALAARTAGRPLLLAGFSGAGAAACDLAHRLTTTTDGGRRAPRVVLTPAPPGAHERARLLARALQDAAAPPPDPEHAAP